MSDNISQAQTAYEVLCRPSERAKYDNHYANVRSAWFRYRKWSEWQKGENTMVVRGHSPRHNKLRSYSHKFMDKMTERRAQRSMVLVRGTSRNIGQEEVSDAAEESKEYHSPQSRSKSSCATDTVTECDAIEPESRSWDETIRIHRSASVPRPTITGKAGGQTWRLSFLPPVPAASCLHQAFIAQRAIRQSA
ncbi:hypothetical protein LY78DRAFT_592100 [Colletotrichum sublineola]|nr:hypothetical protein LY78DRAFT_592100 [Colletotrichum sublineola]